jgi:hypothetical protein
MLTRQAVLDALPSSLRERLAAHFERSHQFFAEDLATGRLDALVLAGGYGRAEGGVATDAAGQPALYNDLDYFLLSRHPADRRLRARVRQWEATESGHLGIDVEAVCIGLGQIEPSGRSMMYYDFLHYHSVIIGPDDYVRRRFAAPPHGCIAPVEATRLLWNRGSGLLFARADLALDESPARALVIHRNQAKVKLGLGDAWLALRGQYRPHVADRETVMAQACGLPPELREWHAQGAAFKRRPSRPPPYAQMKLVQSQLASAWLTLFLEVESTRTGCGLTGSRAYAALPQRLFPESPVWRNFMLGMRDRIRRGGMLTPSWDYPRGALQRALPLLLEAEPDFAAVQRFLGRSCADLATSCAVYRTWWHHYS